MADDNAEITTKYCPSCKQDVPSANFEMHAIHCQRFLTPCPQCGEPVNKNQIQEHIDENHAEVKCEVCGEKVEKMELDNHTTSICRKRNVNCQYCEITLPASAMEEHKESCGSRTEECDNCKRRILVKDLENHLAAGCEMPAKTNGKVDQPQGKYRMPEKLIGGPDYVRDAPRGFGFSFHRNFQPNPYSNERMQNPYFPSAQTYLNNDSPKIPRTVQRTTQKQPTPSSSLTSSPKNISQINRSLVSNEQRSISKTSSDLNSKPDVPIDRRMEQKRAIAVPKKNKIWNV